MQQDNDHIAILLTGTNIGDLRANLTFAKENIEMDGGLIIQESSLYGSEAWGFESNDFLNQALQINTKLHPPELLKKLQNIERKAGRITKTKDHYEARILDIDIIFYNDLIIELPNLEVPHPRLHERRFVLEPVVEIIPDFIHPKLGKSINTLLNDCKDTGKVWNVK